MSSSVHVNYFVLLSENFRKNKAVIFVNVYAYRFHRKFDFCTFNELKTFWPGTSTR